MDVLHKPLQYSNEFLCTDLKGLKHLNSKVHLLSEVRSPGVLRRFPTLITTLKLEVIHIY